jgi:hypothetical protein
VGEVALDAREFLGGKVRQNQLFFSSVVVILLLKLRGASEKVVHFLLDNHWQGFVSKKSAWSKLQRMPLGSWSTWFSAAMSASVTGGASAR